MDVAGRRLLYPARTLMYGNNLLVKKAMLYVLVHLLREAGSAYSIQTATDKARLGIIPGRVVLQQQQLQAARRQYIAGRAAARGGGLLLRRLFHSRQGSRRMGRGLLMQAASAGSRGAVAVLSAHCHRLT